MVEDKQVHIFDLDDTLINTSQAYLEAYYSSVVNIAPILFWDGKKKRYCEK